MHVSPENVFVLNASGLRVEYPPETLRCVPVDHAGLSSQARHVGTVYVILCHAVIERGCLLCRIISNFLKWDCVSGLLPLATEPAVTFCCRPSGEWTL